MTIKLLKCLSELFHMIYKYMTLKLNSGKIFLLAILKEKPTIALVSVY